MTHRTFDEMWPGGPKFLKSGAFPIGTDSVLLADFAGRSSHRRICDLGCGSGILSVMLLGSDARRTAVGIELLPEAAKTARENAEANGMAERFSVITGDLRAHRELAPAGGFDLTISNPPYFQTGSGASAATPERAAARSEGECTLEDVCTAAAYLTRWGGDFAMVHKPERLSEAMCALSAAGLEPKRLRFVHSRAGAAPSLFLIECRRGGHPGLKIEPPLIMTDGSGCDSDEVRRIYRR